MIQTGNWLRPAADRFVVGGKFSGLILGLCLWAFPLDALEADFERVSFTDIPGWQEDDHQAAFDVFLKSCGNKKGKQYISEEIWKPICAFAKTKPDAKVFFEVMFQPVIIGPNSDALFTGYFEPSIAGSRKRGGKFQHAIYKKPPEVKSGTQYKTRGEIEAGALAGRGLEIAYLADPVDTFFLHIQGSGRIDLDNGKPLRVGYAAKNGHKYRSVGAEMVRRKILASGQASAGRIKSWVKRNPNQGKELLNHNKSYVFFREIKSLRSDEGPEGAMRVPLTKMRTVAVDPKFNPLGMPVYLDMSGKYPLQRLMIAQDVGSVIKGPQRADIFFGTGNKAGKSAGRTKNKGRMYTLLPLEVIRDLEAVR